MRAFLSLLTLLLALPLSVAAADLVLIANPKSGIAKLTQDDVTNIYLGRYRRLVSGVTAEPLDLPNESDSKVRFYRQLVSKSLPEINAYWSRLIFAGKTQPPQVVGSAEEAVRLVARRPGTLAYVERPHADARVIVVFEMAN
jgi:hypothetical protein